MNWNKIKNSAKIKDNTTGVNAILFGIPALWAILTAKLVTLVPEIEALAGLGFIAMFAMMFFGYWVLISTIKYYGLKPNAKQLIIYLVLGSIGGMIVAAILGAQAMIILLAAALATSITIFKYVFKTSWEKATKIIITAEIIEMIPLIVLGIIFGLSTTLFAII